MALVNPLKLCIDRQNQVIAQIPGFASAIGQLVQGNGRDLAIQVADPNPTGAFQASTYVPADLNGQLLVLTICSTPTGDGQQKILAQDGAMTWDAANKWFAGTLDLTQPTLTAQIGSDASITATLQVDVVNAGIPQTIYRTEVNILATALSNFIINPPAPNIFLTQAAADARYLRRGPVAGETKTWLSADGTKARLEYVDNDGDMRDDAIAPPPSQ